ncbi:MAG: hypothetical protein WCQ55_04975 [Paludibacteraceae bacterium]
MDTILTWRIASMEAKAFVTHSIQDNAGKLSVRMTAPTIWNFAKNNCDEKE